MIGFYHAESSPSHNSGYTKCLPQAQHRTSHTRGTLSATLAIFTLLRTICKLRLIKSIYLWLRFVLEQCMILFFSDNIRGRIRKLYKHDLRGEKQNECMDKRAA